MHTIHPFYHHPHYTLYLHTITPCHRVHYPLTSACVYASHASTECVTLNDEWWWATRAAVAEFWSDLNSLEIGCQAGWQGDGRASRQFIVIIVVVVEVVVVVVGCPGLLYYTTLCGNVEVLVFLRNKDDNDIYCIFER